MGAYREVHTTWVHTGCDYFYAGSEETTAPVLESSKREGSQHLSAVRGKIECLVPVHPLPAPKYQSTATTAASHRYDS